MLLTTHGRKSIVITTQCNRQCMQLSYKKFRCSAKSCESNRAHNKHSLILPPTCQNQIHLATVFRRRHVTAHLSLFLHQSKQQALRRNQRACVEPIRAYFASNSFHSNDNRYTVTDVCCSTILCTALSLCGCMCGLGYLGHDYRPKDEMSGQSR